MVTSYADCPLFCHTDTFTVSRHESSFLDAPHHSAQQESVDLPRVVQGRKWPTLFLFSFLLFFFILSCGYAARLRPWSDQSMTQAHAIGIDRSAYQWYKICRWTFLLAGYIQFCPWEAIRASIHWTKMRHPSVLPSPPREWTPKNHPGKVFANSTQCRTQMLET
ncbi:uncharacterized protein BO97DRAFT_135432 [Aspergillus homomorphus CBS 101889]|uniref:Uncharacterized protein n=1 Tax=Aspergillus homomorphus (strain CBS 101889) TaxID=1450537 RepID=A0A395I899_ASPHC|nr:hypothetical protein BO97DRAFT_135432 [Aspergillus homomorphus CBS 101889]RAL16480.1 hypothetical protein BO97DRAFT_135432 [Aspergillus homomorphus CBS 101889]